MALVAARLGQFQRLLKTRVILILHFTRPHAITYTNARRFYSSMGNRLAVKGLTTSKVMSPLTTSKTFPINALTAVGALMTLIDFTLSNARRFYSSMGNRLAVKGSTASNTMSPLSTLLFLVSFCFQLSFSSPPTSRITSYTVRYQTATNSYRSINI